MDFSQEEVLLPLRVISELINKHAQIQSRGTKILYVYFFNFKNGPTITQENYLYFLVQLFRVVGIHLEYQNQSLLVVFQGGLHQFLRDTRIGRLGLYKLYCHYPSSISHSN